MNRNKTKSLLKELSLISGLDLSHYSFDFIHKRIIHFSNNNNIDLGNLSIELAQSEDLRSRFIDGLAVLVSEFFRDPKFYKDLQDISLDWLKTFPQNKIWSVGSAQGEESASLAIWLKHNGLYERSMIYATDSSTAALSEAKKHQYAKFVIEKGAENYKEFCQKNDFRDYFKDGHLDSSLSQNITYHDHNVLYDEVFCEAQIVFCRNVLIYYNEASQYKILSLLKRSLTKNGFLCLGKVEHVPLEWRKKLGLKRIECDGKVYRSI